jgi:hypothetical protein
MGITSAGAVPTVLHKVLRGDDARPRQGERFHRVRHRVVAVRHNHKVQAALALVRLRLRLGVEHVGVVAERDVHRPALQGVQLSPGWWGSWC